MSCYCPINGWYSKKRNETGKRSIVFNPGEGYTDRPLSIPCGSCIGCKLERARQWAVRCMHEASLYEENSFVTLTYDDNHLPPNGSLEPKHFVDFMKRLRYYRGPGVRFFHCGEYGTKLGRPHHHVLLFGVGFPDKVPQANSRGHVLYTSEELSRLWPYGFNIIGDCTFESAGYVARYTLKKVSGPGMVSHYGGRLPEYLTMSRQPGIGRGWLEKFKDDVYPSDEMVVNGHITKPPRFYDNVMEKLDKCAVAYVRKRRKELAEAANLATPYVREANKLAQIGALKREIT